MVRGYSLSTQRHGLARTFEPCALAPTYWPKFSMGTNRSSLEQHDFILQRLYECAPAGMKKELFPDYAID